MALSADALQLSNLLAVLTQPDTEAIRQAELALKPLLKDPRCVPALVEILKAKDSQVSTQCAAISGMSPSNTVLTFSWLVSLFHGRFNISRSHHPSVMLPEFCFESD